MLKYRMLTAIVLIPIFIWAILFLPPNWFCILTGALVVYGAWEWSLLMGIQKNMARLIYPVVMVPILVGSLLLPIPLMLFVAVIWWCIASILVLLYPRLSGIWSWGYFTRGTMGLLTLVPCWLAINFIRHTDGGSYTLIFLFVLIWCADTSAYFVGKRFGKHKMTPLVSPGKTWEGLIGAFVGSAIVSLLAAWVFDVPRQVWFAAAVLAFITVLFSVMGDLFESMLKRKVGIKDSGALFPGHGGLLDRIDSLTAAAPVFALGGVLIWQIYQG